MMILKDQFLGKSTTVRAARRSIPLLTCGAALTITLLGAMGCGVTGEPESVNEDVANLESAEPPAVQPSVADGAIPEVPAPGDGNGGASIWASHCPANPAATSATHPIGVATWRIRGGTRIGVCQWGKTQLIMQGDGNLVVYDENHNARWASGTFGGGNYAIFQTDGNLVVYTAGNQPLWSSRTWGRTDLALHVQTDGNVVIYGPNWTPVWSTHSAH